MRIAALITGAVLWLALHPPLVVGQSLGDVARRDRERRATLPSHSRVITNEDLRRERILDSDPPAAAATPAPAESSAPAPPVLVPRSVPLWEVAQQPGFSLGEYAHALRRARRAKTMDAAAPAVALPPSAVAERASQSAMPAPPMPISRPAVAERPRPPPRLSPPQKRAGNPAPAHPQEAGETVRVRKGDCLWKIARVHFGSGTLWTLIWQANPELRNPNRIAAGQRLRMPAGELVAREQLRRRLAVQYRQAPKTAGAHATPAATLTCSPTVLDQARFAASLGHELSSHSPGDDPWVRSRCGALSAVPALPCS